MEKLLKKEPVKLFLVSTFLSEDWNSRAWEKVYIDQYSGAIIGQLNHYDHSADAMYQQTWWMWHTGDFFWVQGTHPMGADLVDPSITGRNRIFTMDE